jgi:peroxiredoxin (alkyl hydroperoxide reductase subunit C)
LKSKGVFDPNKYPGRFKMSENCCYLQVGQDVPDFKLDTFEPTKGDFGEISLEALKAKKKWTILFFYPAAFTFV